MCYDQFYHHISAFTIQSCWRRFIFRRYIVTRILVRQQVINFRRSQSIRILPKALALSW